jgi:ATP-binding cassette, subfamily C, type I secretion system permease/ATPase
MPRRNPETILERAVREARPGFVAALAFSLAVNVLMLAMPLYTMQVYDRVLASGHLETLLLLTLIAGFALLTFGLLEAVRISILARLGTRIGERLAGPLVTAAVTGGQRAGAQPLRDLAQLRNTITGPSIYPLFDAPWVPLFAAAVWLLHPAIGLLAVLSAGTLLLLALATEWLTRAPLGVAGELTLQAQQQADAATRNADVVQAMGLLPGLLARFEGVHGRVLSLQERAAERAGALQGLTRFIRQFVQVAVLGLGAWLVLRSELTGGGMIAASILLGRALAPIEQLIGAWKSLVAARASYRRLQQLCSTCPERPAAMRLPAPRGQLAVESATLLAVNGGRPLLRQVSFALQPGEVLGVIGPSAAGKSTLCRLLTGIVPPTAGHVRLDAADLAAFDRAEIGRHIGYLPQDVALFGGTVKDNIARLGEADPAAIVEAARLAGVHDMILRLPDGYETEIGDGGAHLSGGQRQRIGLARALFGRPCLLVLDEPNANLDQEGEAALLRAIALAKRRGTTVVMVAHRPNVLVHADHLLVLEAGAVTSFGPRAEVAARLMRAPAEQSAEAA